MRSLNKGFHSKYFTAMFDIFVTYIIVIVVVPILTDSEVINKIKNLKDE